jgi:DNA-binding LacI/PurR family transcriptional regulator
MSDRPVKTIADIADICCVSKSTVSRALSDSPQISEETKERIRTVAKSHRFQINIPARRLSMQRSRTIAFVVLSHQSDDCFSVADLFLLEMLGAVSRTLSTDHYDMLVANIDPHEPDWPSQYLDTGKVDGFILLTTSRKQLHVKALLEVGAPFIVWGMPLPNQRYCSVITDNFGGGKKATEYLLEKGKRRIAFVGGPAGEYETQQRYEGYAAALQESGLGVNPALVMYGDHWSSESGSAQTRQILTAAPDLDAIFANSDLMAVGAINQLHEQGRCVPQDVAVVGYDDLSLAKLISPALTTISQKIPQVGKLLAQNLIQFIETGLVTNVTIPAELIIRESA